ncbi:hypothetical protein QYE76_002142 [Lolium multiflorum]|uniref:CCHC-type domain-containing protein n=1 Tax=Lolium multiflorum TaxID=4521 RepID=A0AAD8VY01_LOLMU|nr:hypothetical protein QYE76_002142 [Lolium multiflorum]
MDAEDWLMDTERKLNTVGCNDQEKRREFESQKDNAILTYVREFSKLSRYAVEEVNTEDKKKKRFLRGLSPQFKVQLRMMRATKFQELVDAAITLEDDFKQLQEEKRKKAKYEPKRFVSNKPNTSLSFKPRYNNNNNINYYNSRRNQAFQTANQIACRICGFRGHTSKDCKKPKIICFGCRQEGHMLKDCPKRRNDGGGQSGGGGSRGGNTGGGWKNKKPFGKLNCTSLEEVVNSDQAVIAAGGTFMSITLGAATKLLDDMMINYSEWHTERAPQGKKVNSVEETSSLSDKIDVIMSMLVNGRSNVDLNNVPLASLVAQEENVDVNFIKNNNFNNNAYRNNSGNNYRPYPSANGNGYGNSYGNSYNNNRSVPSGLEAMLKEFISTQTAFNKSVEEKLDKIDTIASRVDRLASDVNLLKLKVMPNNDIDNKITTTANAIQVRINENIRLMAELRARWDREENEKLAKENNVAKVWTITTTSNANSSHVAAPPTINGNIIGVGNVSTPSAKRTKLPEIAKTAETACDKTAEIFPTLGTMIPLL